LVAFSLVSACGGAAPEPVRPTEAPTEAPTDEPAEEPTEAPTETPTEAPTQAPTEAPTQEPIALDAEALLQERCTVCHTLDRVMRASKSHEEWERTVVRMIGHGAVLDDEEQSVIIDYLAQTYGP
jgi:hypothetical protein